MESIDRLREYLDKNVRKLPHTEWIANEPMELRPSRIYGYIDAIEREVEDNERFRREAEPFHDRLCRASERREDVTLFGVDYTALPLDADGIPIHFGDVLDQFGTPMTVFAMSDPDPDQGDCMLELITDGISDGTWVRARKMCHYHAPTVEDVLREFAGAWAEWKDGAAMMNPVETFAAKLRLAGDE